MEARAQLIGQSVCQSTSQNCRFTSSHSDIVTDYTVLEFLTIYHRLKQIDTHTGCHGKNIVNEKRPKTVSRIFASVRVFSSIWLVLA